VLRGQNGAVAIGLGAFGVVVVLSKAVGPDHDALRRLSGWAVAVSFLACMAVDLANRKRFRADGTSS
jgi:hypothetical protein